MSPDIEISKKDILYQIQTVANKTFVTHVLLLNSIRIEQHKQYSRSYKSRRCIIVCLVS